MEVLYLIDHMGLGGAQTLVRGIFEKNPKDVELHLISLRKKQPEILIKNNRNIVNLNQDSAFNKLFKINDYIKENDIKILHCHLFASQIYGYIIKKFFSPSIKLIFHEHGSINNDLFYYDLFLKLVQNEITAVIAISKATKERLISKTKNLKNKIYLLHNYIDIDRHNIKKIKHSGFNVGFAGRIIKRKGWLDFVNAANKLKKYQNINFIVAGTGKDLERMKKIVKIYGIEKKFQFLGFVENMNKYYSQLDCFVMPSHFEGLSVAQLEAMSHGLPCIFSDVIGLNEIPRKNIDAIYVDRESPGEIAESILMLMKDGTIRNKLGRNAIQQARKFNIDKYLIKLINIYKRNVVN